MKKKYLYAAGAVIVNPEGKMLVLHKVQRPPFWEFFKGSQEDNESAEDILRREIQEETGMTEYEIVPGFHETVRYDFHAHDGHIFRTVDYYLIKTAQEPVISAEHTEFRWAALDEALELFTHKNFKDLAKKADDFLKKDG